MSHNGHKLLSCGCPVSTEVRTLQRRRGAVVLTITQCAGCKTLLDCDFVVFPTPQEPERIMLA